MEVRRFICARTWVVITLPGWNEGVSLTVPRIPFSTPIQLKFLDRFCECLFQSPRCRTPSLLNRQSPILAAPLYLDCLRFTNTTMKEYPNLEYRSAQLPHSYESPPECSPTTATNLFPFIVIIPHAITGSLFSSCPDYSSVTSDFSRPCSRLWGAWTQYYHLGLYFDWLSSEAPSLSL